MLYQTLVKISLKNNKTIVNFWFKELLCCIDYQELYQKIRY